MTTITGSDPKMNDPTLHIRVEQIQTLKRQGMPSGHLLRLLVHLKHLCPVCAQEIERYSQLEAEDESWLPDPRMIWPPPTSAETQSLKLRAQEAARQLEILSPTDRSASLTAGFTKATPALCQAWMELRESELGEPSETGEAHARFGLELAQRLDAELLPTILLIDHQAEAWTALAQAALGQGKVGKATLALRVAYLLGEGGTGDPRQAAWFEAMHGMLTCQKGDLEAGAKLIAKGGQIAREIGEPHLMGGIHLLLGLVLTQLGQHQAAMEALRDGIAHVDPGRSCGLVQSAREALAEMGVGAELEPVGEGIEN